MNIRENVPLAGKTSYKIGGRARFYAEPRSEEEVVGACRYAAELGAEALILGNGSNLLISDRGVDGVVINLSAGFAGIGWNGAAAEVLGGFPLDELAAEAARRGCAGMAELSGIPGTVGGAVTMNAGAFEEDVAKTLKSVRVLRKSTLTVETVDAGDLALGYRASAVRGGGDVVLSARFEFGAGSADELLSTRKRILDRRREKQPVDLPSCGSVFKRPPGNYAGTLIESCGLKGFRSGGAAVSEKHANFIINAGNAKAEDVRRVIRHVQKTVHENSGILLEPEVIFIGDFETPLYAGHSSDNY